MDTPDFAAFVQVGQRVEEGLKIQKIFDYSELQSLIEQGVPEKHEQKTNLGATEKGKNVHNIEFCEESKRRQRKEMMDQVFTPLPEPLETYFLNCWPLDQNGTKSDPETAGGNWARCEQLVDIKNEGS